MEIGNIVTGHINEVLNLKQNLSETRLVICRKCPIFSSKLGGLCNSRLWLNPETGDVSTTNKDGYKKGCGCRLKAKTTLANASCPAGKW